MPIAFGMPCWSNLPLCAASWTAQRRAVSRAASSTTSTRESSSGIYPAAHLPGRRRHDRLRAADRQPDEPPPRARRPSSASSSTFVWRAISRASTSQAAASIGIIGGADGPTAIYLTTKLGSGTARADRRRGLLLHGPGADHPAADHEAAHHQEGARDRDGRSCATVSKTERIIFPDRRHHRSVGLLLPAAVPP
ncbi:MAG: sodium ion-translocating decarboxylase subunit beta [Desulfomicrobium escambiense]|nr:sodium ion-translocating decarboxylase subunit beta [Desulfomicrobium escambiense]